MFTDVLRSLRKKNGDTQESLAAKINVPARTYASWERSERVMPNDVLVSIADLYGVTIDYLLGRDEPPPPPRGPETQRVIDAILAKLAQLDGGDQAVVEAHVDFLLDQKRKKEGSP